MCTNRIDSCTSDAQQREWVRPNTARNCATILYVPLPVFSGAITLSGALLPKQYGKPLKTSETSADGIVLMKHPEIPRQLSETVDRVFLHSSRSTHLVPYMLRR